MATTKASTTSSVTNAVALGVAQFAAQNRAFIDTTQFGSESNWNDSMLPITQKMLLQNIFPKIVETSYIGKLLVNRYSFASVEVPNVGHLREEYVFKDFIPSNLKITPYVSTLLDKYLPQVITKLYLRGERKRVRWTLNDTYTTDAFSTVGDCVSYCVNKFVHVISQINLNEEKEMKATLVDYVNKLIYKNGTNTNDVHYVKTTTEKEFSEQLYETVMNLQDQTHEFNHSKTASGGELGSFTTRTALDDVLIVTSSKMKRMLLDTRIANTFNVAGLDITNHIISHYKLCDAYQATADITLEQVEVDFLNAYLLEPVAVGDVISADTVLLIPFNEYEQNTPLKSAMNLIEIPEDSAIVLDANALRYRRVTAGMLKEPFYDQSLDDYTNAIHYYTQKNISPFYNCVLVTLEP